MVIESLIGIAVDPRGPDSEQNLVVVSAGAQLSRGSKRVWSGFDTSLAIVLTLILVASSRTIVSFDSHLYLGSARSLGTGDAGVWYHWIREPLYPALLKVTHGVFGNADFANVLIMSILATSSVGFLAAALFGHSPLIRRLFLVVVLVNPVVHGFIGHIGQQALIMSILAAGVAWALMVSRSPESGLPFKAAMVLAVVIGMAAGLTSFILVPAAFAIALSPLLIRWMRSRGGHSSPTDPSPSIWVMSLSMVAAATLTLGGWWLYKASVTDGTDLAFGGPRIWPWEFVFDTESVQGPEVSVLDKLAGLTGFGPEQQVINGEIVLLPAATEQRKYGGVDRDWSSDYCGVVDAGPEPIESYAEGYLDLTCRPPWGGLPRVVLGDVALLGFRIGLVSLVLALVLAPWRPRYLAFALPALGLVGPYLIGTLGISRYSIPLWPLGVAAALSIVGDAATRIKRNEREQTGLPRTGGRTPAALPQADSLP